MDCNTPQHPCTEQWLGRDIGLPKIPALVAPEIIVAWAAQ
jgi:hypothetical protein